MLRKVLLILPAITCVLGVADKRETQQSYHPPHTDYYGEDDPKYSFEWEVHDEESGNNYGHQEERDGDETEGYFYTLLPDGRTQKVSYHVEGDSGFIAEVEYEGEASYSREETSYHIRKRHQKRKKHVSSYEDSNEGRSYEQRKHHRQPKPQQIYRFSEEREDQKEEQQQLNLLQEHEHLQQLQQKQQQQQHFDTLQQRVQLQQQLQHQLLQQLNQQDRLKEQQLHNQQLERQQQEQEHQQQLKLKKLKQRQQQQKKDKKQQRQQQQQLQQQHQQLKFIQLEQLHQLQEQRQQQLKQQELEQQQLKQQQLRNQQLQHQQEQQRLKQQQLKQQQLQQQRQLELKQQQLKLQQLIQQQLRQQNQLQRLHHRRSTDPQQLPPNPIYILRLHENTLQKANPSPSSSEKETRGNAGEQQGNSHEVNYVQQLLNLRDVSGEAGYPSFQILNTALGEGFFFPAGEEEAISPPQGQFSEEQGQGLPYQQSFPVVLTAEQIKGLLEY